jgi:hypothetical protein
MIIKARKIGATGVAFSGRAEGVKITANASEHGYKYRLQVEIDFAALSEKQGQKVHKAVFDAATQSLSAAADMRSVNVPLFDLDDLPKNVTEKGINEL